MKKFKHYSTDKLKSMLDDGKLEHKEERFARSILVDRFMRHNGVDTLDFKDGGDAEPYFSRGGCDCCSHRLGNDVYEVVGYHRKSEVIDVGEVCSSCIEIYYNGV